MKNLFSFISVLFLVMFLSLGCAGKQCYIIQDFPTICIVDDTFLLNKDLKKFLDQGHSAVCTTKFRQLIGYDTATSFYIEKENVLYAVDDLCTIFTQLWYIKGNSELPNWPIDFKIFKIEQR